MFSDQAPECGVWTHFSNFTFVFFLRNESLCSSSLQLDTSPLLLLSDFGYTQEEAWCSFLCAAPASRCCEPCQLQLGPVFPAVPADMKSHPEQIFPLSIEAGSLAPTTGVRGAIFHPSFNAGVETVTLVSGSKRFDTLLYDVEPTVSKAENLIYSCKRIQNSIYCHLSLKQCSVLPN